MKTPSHVLVLALSLSVATLAGVAPARAGCLQDFYDMGDAPGCIPAYPSGVLGRFPTSYQQCGSGTQEVSPLCPPRSSPPGVPGYVMHVNNYDAWQLWLGCFGEGYLGVTGADDDRVPQVGCTETAFGGMTFSQDECFGDGADAGLLTAPEFRVCEPAAVSVSLVNCSSSPICLNVLIDMNADGDWNDSFTCAPNTPACAFEWAIKNQLLPLTVDLCRTYTSPEFMMGPFAGPAWMRITVSTNPAADSYPWNGESLFNNVPVAQLYGGETEDYPVLIDLQTRAEPASWGRVKTLYR